MLRRTAGSHAHASEARAAARPILLVTAAFVATKAAALGMA